MLAAKRAGMTPKTIGFLTGITTGTVYMNTLRARREEQKEVA